MWSVEFINRIFTRLNRKDYFQGRHLLAQMIRIKCVKCKDVFEFNDYAIGAAGPSDPKSKFAQKYIIVCPFCHAENMVWLERPSETSSHMDFITVRNEPQSFR